MRNFVISSFIQSCDDRNVDDIINNIFETADSNEMEDKKKIYKTILMNNEASNLFKTLFQIEPQNLELN